jgi:CRP-like cAMP-binding protein
MQEDPADLSAFPRGTILFRQGDSANAAYALNAGAIGLYRETGGRRVPLTTVRRGEMFGELAVIDGSPRQSSAVTLEDSLIMVIPRAALADKIAAADPLIKALMEMFSANLRNVHETYVPKSRSLLDGVNSLSRQYDVVSRFVRGNMPPDLRQTFEGRLKVLDGLVKDMRRIAMAHREQDRRDDAVPHEADLPS